MLVIFKLHNTAVGKVWINLDFKRESKLEAETPSKNTLKVMSSETKLGFVI